VSRDAEQIEQQNHEQADNDPEEQIFCPGIHPLLLVAGPLNSRANPRA
jgi:hypothetical protein